MQYQLVGAGMGYLQRCSQHSPHSRNYKSAQLGLQHQGVKFSEEDMKELEAAVPQEDIAGTRYASMDSTWQKARTPSLSSWKGVRE